MATPKKRVMSYWRVIWPKDTLELVSKMPEQDQHTGQVNKALKHFKFMIPPGDDAAELLPPCEESFDLPSTPVAAP